MYVYAPPQGHHTPPHPMGGGGNTGHGTIYICNIPLSRFPINGNLYVQQFMPQ